MADFLVKIDGIEGEATLSGYEGWIECTSMKHAISLPVVAQASGRTEGTSRHGAMFMLHAIDKATPALKLACAAGANVGDVEVHRMRMIGGQARPVEQINLTRVMVSEAGIDTAIDPETNELGSEPDEVFALAYADIRWTAQHYVDGTDSGAVEGGWSTATQSVL